MTITDHLITLKAQYESAIETADTNTEHYKEQLTHINALLLEQLLHSNNGFESTATLISHTPVAEISVTPKSKIESHKPKAITAKAPDSRISLPLLPAYQGLKKLEAIGQVLENALGQVLHQDEIIQTLYGDLHPQALKIERLRMKTAMYQGVKQKLWQKAPKPSSYILKGSKTKTAAKATSSATKAGNSKVKSLKTTPKITPNAVSASKIAKQVKKTAAKAAIDTPKMLGAKPILPMHKDFAGLSKIDAVLKVMQENSGKTVHIDTIMKRLFGTLSIEEAKAEKGRMKNVMSRGSEGGLWTKTRAPLSFIVNKSATPSSNAKSSKSKTEGLKGRK